jgi:hypothetical protein
MEGSWLAASNMSGEEISDAIHLEKTGAGTTDGLSRTENIVATNEIPMRGFVQSPF